MNRVGYGMTHKIKGSMDFGLKYPVFRQEMIPGDIIRINPEVFIQAVVPPVVQLTDKISYKLEADFVPYRLLDDDFVRNMTTSKDGTVKGNFKTWSLSQIRDNYGSQVNGKTNPKRIKSSGLNIGYIDKVPSAFKERSVVGVATHKFDSTEKCKLSGFALKGYKGEEGFNECLPVGVKTSAMFNIDSTNGYDVRNANYFGQGSLFDWLSLEPNGNIGQFGVNSDGSDLKFNTFAISAYYMINNFRNTRPEYQKYIAPYFDYVQVGRDNSENRKTLHRYETLEEEFGNGFEEPSWSGRCVNGLVIDNWSNDYFSNTMKTPQRGVAPVVPVSIKGTMPFFGKISNPSSTYNSNSDSALYVGPNPSGVPRVNDGTDNFWLQTSDNPSGGSFVISDLRSALALQHFQEDTQDCFKWSDWLQKVYGISPSDNTLDEPHFIGAMSGVLSSSPVVATSSTSGSELGEIGGKLGTYDSGKMFTYKAEEHGIVMVTMVIKPERTYQSGVDKMFLRKNYLDMYFKYFTGIGNQAISIQELSACVDSSVPRDGNFGFTSRYEEFRHMKNRVVSKCRNDNMTVPVIAKSGSNLVISREHASLRSVRDSGGAVPYLNSFHPYAISDAYVTGSSFADSELIVNENSQDFILCLPQLNDIFVDDTEEPFMSVIGFNCDMLRPIPQVTSPGVPYV